MTRWRDHSRSGPTPPERIRGPLPFRPITITIPTIRDTANAALCLRPIVLTHPLSSRLLTLLRPLPSHGPRTPSRPLPKLHRHRPNQAPKTSNRSHDDGGPSLYGARLPRYLHLPPPQ